MKVVILCGGKGTRLREETEYRPKPMVPIGNRPILWHIMKIYAAHGHTDFILCLGYRGEVIKTWFRDLHWMTSDVCLTIGQPDKTQFFGDISERDWRVTLVDTGQETMTAGRIKRIEKYLENDKEFLLTYGDGVGNINITESIQYHRQQERILTLTGVRPPGRWGEIQENNGVVEHFFEKPQTSDGLINGGFFVVDRQVFKYISDDPLQSFENEPLNRLSLEKQISCYQHNGFWQPMDTYQEYLLINKLWENGQAEWRIW